MPSVAVPENFEKIPRKALDSHILTGYNEQACRENARFLCADNLIIATAQPHRSLWRINREVKWNANIQPVS